MQSITLNNSNTKPINHTKNNIVVIRCFNDGQIISFFPYVSFSHDARYCSSFMRGEGHGAADTSIIKETIPATQEEIETELSILESIGYKNLIIKKRIQHYYSYLYRSTH